MHPVRDPFALHRDKDYYYEIIKSGNKTGDNDNWALHIDGNDLCFYYKESGAWKKGGIDMGRAE